MDAVIEAEVAQLRAVVTKCAIASFGGAQEARSFAFITVLINTILDIIKKSINTNGPNYTLVGV